MRRREFWVSVNEPRMKHIARMYEMRQSMRIYVYNPIDRAVPNGLSLYMLGAGLLAAGLAQIAVVIAYLAVADRYYYARLDWGLSLIPLALANCAVTAVAVANLLRRSSSLAASFRGDRPPAFAVWFIHLAVAYHAALSLSLLLPFLRVFIDVSLPLVLDILLLLAWTSLAGGALISALANRLNWNARRAALGAVVSAATFGCAVGYAPAIYGWDLRPMGWYAILAAAIPVLAFLALFLRRYSPVFSASSRRRFGLAIALFAALICAMAALMIANPADRFGNELRAALDGGADEIKFSDLTDFEWDAVEIYDPYASNKSLSPAAREGTDILSRSRFGYSEILDFAVFLKDGEVVYHEVVWRDNHAIRYPSGGTYPWTVPLEDAVFKVEYRDGGYRVLTIAER